MYSPIDKTQLVAAIMLRLHAELATAIAASEQAHESATHSENIAENKYDTLGLEAAYLAHGQSVRVNELQQAIALYRSFPIVAADEREPIKPGAILGLENPVGVRQYVFIGPAAGGYVIDEQAGAVQVVSTAA